MDKDVSASIRENDNLKASITKKTIRLEGLKREIVSNAPAIRKEKMEVDDELRNVVAYNQDLTTLLGKIDDHFRSQISKF